MTDKKRPRESDDKGEAGAKTKTPMERFKTLTKKIVSVPRDRVQEEQRRYDEAKSARRKSKP